MEAGDCTASNCKEHEGPNGFAGIVQVLQSQLYHRVIGGVVDGTDNGAAADTERHNDKADAENGIEFANEFIDGEQCCQEEIDEHHNDPELFVECRRGHIGNQTSGTDHKYDADHHEQNNRENAHDLFHTVAKVFAGDLRNRGTVIADREHTRKIIVYAAGKNSTKDYP